MNEVSVMLSDMTLEQIEAAADKRGVEPEKMIQAIILEWALRDIMTRASK